MKISIDTTTEKKLFSALTAKAKTHLQSAKNSAKQTALTVVTKLKTTLEK